MISNDHNDSSNLRIFVKIFDKIFMSGKTYAKWRKKVQNQKAAGFKPIGPGRQHKWFSYNKGQNEVLKGLVIPLIKQLSEEFNIVGDVKTDHDVVYNLERRVRTVQKNLAKIKVKAKRPAGLKLGDRGGVSTK